MSKIGLVVLFLSNVVYSDHIDFNLRCGKLESITGVYQNTNINIKFVRIVSTNKIVLRASTTEAKNKIKYFISEFFNSGYIACDKYNVDCKVVELICI